MPVSPCRLGARPLGHECFNQEWRLCQLLDWPRLPLRTLGADGHVAQQEHRKCHGMFLALAALMLLRLSCARYGCP
eukprot:7768390-Pyramimonas_sp.AAC.1